MFSCFLGIFSSSYVFRYIFFHVSSMFNRQSKGVASLWHIKKVPFYSDLFFKRPLAT